MKDFFSTIFGFAFIAGIWLVVIYNKLVPLLEQCRSNEANYSAELQRKFDLYIKLSEALAGGSEFEKSVFIKIAELRTNANIGLVEKINSANHLLAAAESNPKVESVELFKIYQIQISETESRIQEAKKVFNESVNFFNSEIKLFPINVACILLRFKPQSYIR